MIFNAHQMPPDRPWQSSLQVVKADLGEYSWMIFRCSNSFCEYRLCSLETSLITRMLNTILGTHQTMLDLMQAWPRKNMPKNPPTWRTTSTYREGCPPPCSRRIMFQDLQTRCVNISTSKGKHWKHSRLRSLPRWWIPWFPKSDFWSVPLVFFSHESQPSTKRAPKKNIAKSTSKSSSLGMAAFCLVFSCSKRFNNGESFTQHR